MRYNRETYEAMATFSWIVFGTIEVIFYDFFFKDIQSMFVC